MPNQFSTMSLDAVYNLYGAKIDTLVRQIANKVQYDFSMDAKELADDAVARAWQAMPELLAKYNPEISPLMPYLGQRLRWLFATEKRNNTIRGQREFYSPEDRIAEKNQSAKSVDIFMEDERRAAILGTLEMLQKMVPAGKHHDCLDAFIAQMDDESLDVPTLMKLSRQQVHNLKKAIPGLIKPKFAEEIRDLLRNDDSGTRYSTPTAKRHDSHSYYNGKMVA